MCLRKAKKTTKEENENQKNGGYASKHCLCWYRSFPLVVTMRQVQLNMLFSTKNYGKLQNEKKKREEKNIQKLHIITFEFVCTVVSRYTEIKRKATEISYDRQRKFES